MHTSGWTTEVDGLLALQDVNLRSTHNCFDCLLCHTDLYHFVQHWVATKATQAAFNS